MLARDEGHGFQRKGNRDAYTTAEVAFIRRFLVGAPVHRRKSLLGLQ